MGLLHMAQALFLGMIANPEASEMPNKCILVADDGLVVCFDAGPERWACHIRCNFVFQGIYHCSEKKGWEEQYPDCAHLKNVTRAPTCRDDEVYSECQGHCQKSCHRQDMPSYCTPKVCVGACVCARGLVRDQDGKCVPRSACTTSEEKPSSDVTSCNRVACHKICVSRGLGWRCSEGRCLCGDFEENLSADVTLCDRVACMRKCSRRGMSGSCYGGRCECNVLAPKTNSLLDVSACDPNTCTDNCAVQGKHGNCVGDDCICEDSAAQKTSAEATHCNPASCGRQCGKILANGNCVNGRCECSNNPFL